MSDRPSRVIKQPPAERVSVVSMDTFVPGEKRRIPRERVRAEEGAGRDLTSARRVVTRNAAQLAAEPFELAELPLLPRSVEETPRQADEPDEPEPEPSVEEVEATWQARMDEAVAEARLAAYEEGYAAAEAELGRDVDAAREEYARDLSRIEQAWREALQALEPQLAQLAFRVAEVILDAPLPEEVVAVSERALTEAVERVAGEASVDLSLHPVDYLRLQEGGIEERLTSLHAGLRFHPDASLKQGDWIVDATSSTVRRLEQELLLALRNRLGITPSEE